MSTEKRLGRRRAADIEYICKLIVDHLKHNPRAEEAIEGIAEWWLREQQIRFALEQVQEALERLIEKNVIATRRGLDGRISYRLKGDRDTG